MTFADSIRTCFAKYADFNGTASRSEFWLFYLAVLLPDLAVGARRLHDTGKSGWWQLLLIVPLGVIVLIVFWVQESKR